jgi:hypothetical protein
MCKHLVETRRRSRLSGTRTADAGRETGVQSSVSKNGRKIKKYIEYTFYARYGFRGVYPTGLAGGGARASTGHCHWGLGSHWGSSQHATC